MNPKSLIGIALLLVLTVSIIQYFNSKSKKKENEETIEKMNKNQSTYALVHSARLGSWKWKKYFPWQVATPNFSQPYRLSKIL